MSELDECTGYNNANGFSFQISLIRLKDVQILFTYMADVCSCKAEGLQVNWITHLGEAKRPVLWDLTKMALAANL